MFLRECKTQKMSLEAWREITFCYMSAEDGNLLNGCMSYSLQSLMTFPEYPAVGKEQGREI